MTYRQVELVSPSDECEELVCWLPTDPRVKQGSYVELKELPGITWRVRAVYRTELEREALDKRWRVGGLA